MHPCLSRTQRFITLFTTAPYWTIPWASRIQATTSNPGYLKGPFNNIPPHILRPTIWSPPSRVKKLWALPIFPNALYFTSISWSHNSITSTWNIAHSALFRVSQQWYFKPKSYGINLHKNRARMPWKKYKLRSLAHLKTEAVCFFRTLLPTYQTVRHNMNHHISGTFKSYN
jgi:hypothetical protein